MDEKEENIQENNSGFSNCSNKPCFTDSVRKNPWIASTLVLGIITLILLVGSFNPTGGVVGVASDDVGNSILGLAQAQVPDTELVEVTEESGLYKVVLSMNGQDVPVYVTKDGENLISGLTPLAVLQERASDSETPSQPTEITKSDKPVVELFVMTHCPYGTQAEKGFIPAIKALGDSVDAKIRFVHYFMHDPEETETPIQVCIREEQEAKFLPYLECFLEDGDSDRCLTEAKVDKTKLNTCIENGKAEEYYAEDSELSEGYGVQGSPTLIINGVISSAGRDSASYLAGICSAFNNAPAMCDQELSTSSPSPGFGWEGTGSNTDASC